MQENNNSGNISHRSYSYNIIANENPPISNSSVDIVDQIDKVINKYRNQLESLKPKNCLEYDNYKYEPNNQISNPNRTISHFDNNINFYKTEINSNSYQNSPKNFDFNPNYNRTDINYGQNYKNNTINNNNKNDSFPNNANNYNFDYSDNTNVEQKLGKEENISRNYEKYTQNSSLNKELENDNIKLQSLLTLEKTKVVQLTNLLKEKESEINSLKQKINSIEAEFTNIINELKFKYENYNSQTVELNKKIIKEFFEYFNQNLSLFSKTNILKLNFNEKLAFIENDGNSNEKNAIFIIDAFDKLIKKLLVDNKQLYNELSNFTNALDETKNKTINLSKNLEIMKNENDNLKKEIYELANTNNLLREKNSQIEQNCKISNEFVKNKSYSHLQNYCVDQYNNNNYLNNPDYAYNASNNKKINNNNNNCRSITPIQQLKNKIVDIENLIMNQN